MGVTAHLNNPRLGVEPGGETACEVQVRNAGSVVDQFTVDVVGFARDWAVIEPPTINLFPGAEATTRVVFRPPRSSQVQAGPVPFGVRVPSREDPRVKAGRVRITQTSRGVTVDINASVLFNEGDAALAGNARATLQAEPGTTTLVKTRIKPKKRFLKGTPQAHPFQLLVVPDGGDAATADGVMTQEQLLPKWLLPAAAALAALAVVGLVLWLTLVRPAIKSLAREQAAQQVKQVADTANQAKQSAAAAQQTAAAADKKVDDATSKSGTGTGTGSGGSGSGGATKATDTSGNAALNTGTPTTFRVVVQANKVTDGSFTTSSFTAPNHQKLNIFDLLLQNPRGDAGILQIKQGSTVLLEEGLANYRDSDQHFQVPWSFDKDQPVVVSVNCTQPGPGATQCTSGVLFSGRLVK